MTRMRRDGNHRTGQKCDVTLIMPTTSWKEPFAACARRVLELLDTARCVAEFIIVHDGPMTKPPAWLRRPDVRVVATRARGGPAAARNKAAEQARGRILFFVDADVELAFDALDRVYAAFAADDELMAVFGAYDDSPAATSLVSQYRNLLHHHMHVSHPGQAKTFWAGCGAVRATQFQDIGGFDEGFTSPSVEDIDLGMRIAVHGGRIELEPRLQGKHHKAWTLWSMITTDIASRAVPWTRLITSTGNLPATLNVDWKNRICGVLAVAGVAAAMWAVWTGTGLIAAIACVAVVVAMNLDFYLLCMRRRGAVFAIAAAALHFLFFIYSSVTFGTVVLSTLAFGNRQPSCTSRSNPEFGTNPPPGESEMVMPKMVQSVA